MQNEYTEAPGDMVKAELHNCGLELLASANTQLAILEE